MKVDNLKYLFFYIKSFERHMDFYPVKFLKNKDEKKLNYIDVKNRIMDQVDSNHAI